MSAKEHRLHSRLQALADREERRPKRLAPAPSSPRPTHKPKLCHGCGRGGHLIRNFPSRRPDPRPAKLCHGCGKAGHFVRNCPSIPPKSQKPMAVYPDLNTLLNRVLDEGTQVDQHCKVVLNLPYDPPATLVAALERENTRLYDQFTGYCEGLDRVVNSQMSREPRLEYTRKAAEEHLRSLGLAWKRLATEQKRPPGSAFEGPTPGMTPKGLATPAPKPPEQEASRVALRHVFTDILHLAYPADHPTSGRGADPLRPSPHPFHDIIPQQSRPPYPLGGRASTPLRHPRNYPSPLDCQPLLFRRRAISLSWVLICITSLLDQPPLIPIPTTGSEAPAFPVACAWIRDLTREGVEPNPGPDNMQVDQPSTTPSDSSHLAHASDPPAAFQTQAASHQRTWVHSAVRPSRFPASEDVDPTPGLWINKSAAPSPSHRAGGKDRRPENLVCGDIESNPGPVKVGLAPPKGMSQLWHQRQQSQQSLPPQAGVTDAGSVEHQSPSPKRARHGVEMVEPPSEGAPQDANMLELDDSRTEAPPSSNIADDQVNRTLFSTPAEFPPRVPEARAPTPAENSLPGVNAPRIFSGLPLFLPSSGLVSMVCRAQGSPVDIYIFGDGKPIPTLPEGATVLDPTQHDGLQPPDLQGHHSLFLFPKFIPFKDSPPEYSLRAWCTLMFAALQGAGTSETKITVVLESRFSTPHLPSLPLLDRRFELDRLRRFLVRIVVLPDTRLCERCASSGEVQLCRQPPIYPLILFAYRGGASFDTLPEHEVWRDPSSSVGGGVIPPDSAKAVHVLMNYETPNEPEIVHPVSALRFLMAMNSLSADETSSDFKLATTLRYPATILPVIQRQSPENATIAHLYVGSDWLTRMEEDRAFLLELGFSWCILGDGKERFFLNHLPRRKGNGPPEKKRQSPLVRDAIMSAPQVLASFQELLLFSRWDVVAVMEAGVSRSHVAQSLEQLDHILVQDASQFLRVSPTDRSGRVEPPQILIQFPPSLLLEFVAGELAKIFSLRTVLPSSEAGRALVCAEEPRCASLLYGCSIPCAGHGFIVLTSGSPGQDAEWEARLGLPQNAVLSVRQEAIRSLDGQAPARLSGPNLAALPSSTSGNDPIARLGDSPGISP